MPGPTAWQQQQFVYNSAATNLITTAETVVATLVGVFSRSPGSPINLNGNVGLTTGTGTTSVSVRIRQDSLTGTQVGPTLSYVATAGQGFTADIMQQDASAVEYANKTYVLTVAQVGATANGAMSLAVLQATF